MSLWDKIKSARETNAERFVYSRIPRERTDETFVDAPLVADRSYFLLAAVVPTGSFRQRRAPSPVRSTAGGPSGSGRGRTT
jgi:hypothetical protein